VSQKSLFGFISFKIQAFVKYSGRTSDGQYSPVQAQCAPFTLMDGITAPSFTQTATYRMTSWTSNKTTATGTPGTGTSVTKTTSKDGVLNGGNSNDDLSATQSMSDKFYTKSIDTHACILFSTDLYFH